MACAVVRRAGSFARLAGFRMTSVEGKAMTSVGLRRVQIQTGKPDMVFNFIFCL
jgi:hypothetical protein